MLPDIIFQCHRGVTIKRDQFSSYVDSPQVPEQPHTGVAVEALELGKSLTILGANSMQQRLYNNHVALCIVEVDLGTYNGSILRQI